jgi:hypothetical protein
MGLIKWVEVWEARKRASSVGGAGKFSISSDRVKHAQQPEPGVSPFLMSHRA